MKIKIVCSALLLFVTLGASAIDHNPLLPQPQKVVYGKGQLKLKGLTISFAATPTTEDRFAANELSTIFSKIAGTTITVNENKTTGATILFERTGNGSHLPLPGEKGGPGSRESYKITVTTTGVRITAPSSAGLFYAGQTLRQLAEGTGDNAVLPEVSIEDWPAFVYRGFMMDMSHTQLPRIQEIKNQLDFLARWKANQYLFYSEGSIELDGYPLLMADARFTKEQVKEIIEYGKARHIDVIPNLELYGHLHDLFRIEHYSNLSIIPHGGEFNPYEPQVIKIITDWITQVAQLFPSPFFHIGFDETWLLEEAARKFSKTPEEVYLHMLNQTTDIVEKQNKTPLVWVDMLQQYPSIIPKVSKKIVAVPWHYGIMSEKEYEQYLGPFPKAGIDMIVQSAILNWEWVVPDVENSFLNTAELIRQGKKYKAVGYITSGWTDDTQTLMRLGFPDIAYGAAISWQQEIIDRATFYRLYTQVQYSPTLAANVEKAHLSLQESGYLLKNIFGRTDDALWANPFTAKSLATVAANRADIIKARLAAEEAQINAREALKYGVDTTTLYSILTGALVLDYLALKYLYANEVDEIYNNVRKNPTSREAKRMLNNQVTYKYHTVSSDMLDAITELKFVFEKAWLNEYERFRLGFALGKYDVEFQFWWKLQRRLIDLKGVDADQPLPSLEALTKDL